MPYAPQTWQDGNPAYPLSAARMTVIEQGIASAYPVYNVKDSAYGAKGDGSTDDTQAIQVAITAALVSGGTVFFPPGRYVVNGGLTIGATSTNPIALEGCGSIYTGAHVSALVRTGGSAPILTCAGTGQNLWERSRVSIFSLALDGGGQPGVVARLNRCSEVVFRDVRVRGAAGTALWGTELWNCIFDACWFSDSGSGAGSPVVLFDAVPGTPGANCDTVLMSNCQWEGNSGVELRLTGDTGAGTPSSAICLVNFKMEHNTTSAAYPLIDLAYAQMVQISNGLLTVNNPASTCYFVSQTSPTTQSKPSKLSNLQFDHTGTPSYYVINAAGGMMLANVACDGVPGIAYVYCSQTGTACADTTIVSGLRVNNNSKRFKDDRSSGHFGDVTEGGIAPSLLNGWTNYSPAHQEAAFFKDPFGFVHLNGVIKGGKVGGGSPILVLPPSYRPAKYILFSVTAAGQHGEAQVAANGNVTLQSGGNAWLSLNGISFRAA